MDHEQRKSRVIAGSPVPYAWVVLATALLTMVMTLPGQTAGISVFLDPIIADLGLTRSTVSLLYTVGTLLGSFSLPFIGRFIDRRGPRLAVGLIAGAFSLACLFMSGVRGLVTLAIAFVLVRGLGQGALSLVSQHVVNIWFVRRRGLAIGLMGVGMAIATALFPSVLQSLIDVQGWRLSFASLGILVAVVTIPLGVTFFRGHPETYGQRPDGPRRRAEDVTEEAPIEETNLSLREARRTSAFWLVAAGDVAVSALSTGLVFHHFDILATNGIGREAAALVFVPLGLINAAANLGTGALLDRAPPRFALSGMLVFQAAALALGGWLSPALVFVYGGLIGITQGMKNAISGSAFAYYFGREHIGSIKGFATTLSVAGTAVGPLLFAVGRDVSGTYLPVLLASAAVPALLALASLRLRPPRLRASEA